MAESQASPATSGKAFQSSVEAAYDEIAEREGIDEFGDDLPGEPEEELDEQIDDAGEESEDDSVKDSQESEEEHVGEQTQPLAAGSEEILPPHTWPAEWKEAFNKVNDPELRKVMIEQNANMNRAFTQKMTELSKFRREAEGIRNAVNPHIDRLSRAGITPDVAVQRSLAWDAHIQANPAQGIADMAKAYGVDLAQVGGNQEDVTRYMTPTERELWEKNQSSTNDVQQIKQQFQQFQQMQRQQEWASRQQNAHGMLEEFMNAKDAEGNQLHPYIEHVAPLMAKMINQDLAENLEDAYQKAAWSTPEVRDALLKRRQAQESAGRKRQVEKVRKASSGIVNKSSGKPGKRIRSVEEQVTAAYDAVSNR